MQAVRYETYGSIPTIVDVPDPVCPDDGVLVEVRASGVCRSDWHAWQGHDPVSLPRIPGHEFAGVIVAVGDEVTTRTVGERVTVPFVCGCGHCEWCASGDAQVCPNQSQPGFTFDGSFAELVAVPAADLNVVPLPESLDFVAAASLGCRFATAYRALTVHARVAAGDWVVVHGCGGAGLSAIMIATALGARVIAVDQSAAALVRARECGAIATVVAATSAVADATGQSGATGLADATEQPAVIEQSGVLEQLLQLTGGGAHVSIDAVGSAAIAALSVRSLRPRGRHVQVGLLLGAAASAPLPMGEVIAKELEIYGSHGMAARHYPAMLELVASGEVRPDLLVGRVISLGEAPAALEAMGRPGAATGITVIELAPPG